MKKIATTLFILILIAGIGFQLYERGNQKNVIHTFQKIGYQISFQYNPEHWNVSELDRERFDRYTSFIYLEDKERPREKYIAFRYTLENNGDDTPHIAGDTGAGMWPPQPEELMVDFDKDKYRYLGTYLGKELYVEKNPEMSMGVFQKLKNGKLTARMPLLSKDQERVNYYDYFSIIANARGSEFTEKDYKELHDEFIKILKTMKIEKIPDTTKTTE